MAGAIVHIANHHQQLLLALARNTIATALSTGQNPPVRLDDFPKELRNIQSSFVTLRLNEQLRGCIGALQAREALVVDVAKHAYAAAFRDPRFPPLTASEFEQVTIEVSVLSPQIEIPCKSEAELLQCLQPNVDGLTLRDGHQHATFLPSVWEQLPNKKQFLQQLKRKAGMPDNYWSKSLQVSRYTTTQFEEQHTPR